MQRRAIAAALHVHDARAVRARDRLATVVGTVVGDHDFALDPRPPEERLRLVDADAERLGLVQARHDDRDLERLGLGERPFDIRHRGVHRMLAGRLQFPFLIRAPITPR